MWLKNGSNPFRPTATSPYQGRKLRIAYLLPARGAVERSETEGLKEFPLLIGEGQGEVYNETPIDSSLRYASFRMTTIKKALP